MDKYQHSFVIAAYGDSPYIEECIRSLRNQTVTSDIRIAASAHTPFIEKISLKYNIPLSVNPFSKGIASDWTFAYGNCSTKYMTIAHQDDIYMPYYTELCLSAAADNPRSLIMFTGYSELRRNTTAIACINFIVKSALLAPFLFKKNVSSSFMKKMILSLGNPICCPSVMFNKENIGVLKFSDDFKVSLDWQQWLKLAGGEGDFVYIRNKLLRHRIHEKSASSLQIINSVRQREDELIFSRIWPCFFASILARLYFLASESTKVKE